MSLWHRNRPRSLINRAVAHYESARLAESETLCREALRSNPRDFDVLRLLGMIRLQAGAPQEAIDFLRSALAQQSDNADVQNRLGDAYSFIGDLGNARQHYLAATEADPNSSEAFNNVGVTYAREHRPADAEHYFARAATLEPEWGVPHFNLGLSLREQGAIDRAMKEFHRAWTLDPMMIDAMHECAGAAAQLARATSDRSKPATGEPSNGDLATTTSFSIVFCSIDNAKCEATVSMYKRLFAGVPHELIPIRDARSLAEAYNRGVAASNGDVIVLSHDDIDILADDCAQRLGTHLQTFDAVGVIGATSLNGPTWRWSGHPHLRGWITHRARDDNKWYAAMVDPRPIAGDVVVLDGVFLAARREVCRDIAFDEETFDGFHLYDIDWSYRVAQAGYRVAAAGDLLIVHASRGRFGDVWTKYADRFCVKHRFANLSPPARSDWAEIVFGDASEVRAFYCLLGTMND